MLTFSVDWHGVLWGECHAGASVVIVELPWLISRCRRPVWLQSRYITHADYFPRWQKYGLHFLYCSLRVSPYILLDPGSSKQLGVKLIMAPILWKTKPHSTAKIGALTTGRWLISLWLVPAVHQASGYRSYKDVTGLLSLLLGSPRDCHKKNGQWITQSQRMKTTQPGDVNLKDIQYPLVTGRQVGPALAWLTLDDFNGRSFFAGL